MQISLRVLLAVVLTYAFALSVRAVMGIRWRALRLAVASIARAGTALSAMVIPRTAGLTRGFVAILGILFLARGASYFYEGLDRARGGWIGYLRFLSFGLLRPHLIWSPELLRRGSKPAVAREIARFIAGAAVSAAAWFAGEGLLVTDAAERSWWVNHVVLVLAFSVIMSANGQVLLATWRLLRLPRIRGPLADGIFLSRTPEEFWRRWSWPPHVYLYRYVYQRVGGRAHHARGVWLSFAVSGIGHEILAFAAIGRVGGQQMIFFLLSAAGVLASPPLERLARHGRPGEAVARGVTLAFLVASAAFMFATFDQVLCLYRRPSWVEW